ncbi:protein of unknown function DUF2122 [Pyrolobus fumarii 1A]|uniref:RecB-family nuclease-like protein n=1 Tax=Pyrolobus fumarii (strain DSM 11204 / 1A) TaxID=694429 RepID=G0EEQ8_PYRF1|nr:RecB-family nuclease [Pyrolobus fumarii]AEM38880.1 protein of unknown function DUF2122 [Pyrolobus fumarii 1A]
MVATVIPVVHDVSSAQRLIDMARTVYGLGYRVLVATRVYGAAAQNGVPEAMRIALRLGRSFVTLPELRDAVELFTPNTIIVVSKDYGEPMTIDEIAGLAKDKTMIVFGGGDPGITKQDIAVGRPVYIKGVEGRLSPVAEAALILYALRSQTQEPRDTQSS